MDSRSKTRKPTTSIWAARSARKTSPNSGELQHTNFTAVNLPATLIYARLWTKVADRWRFVDITFTSAPTDAIAFVVSGPGRHARRHAAAVRVDSGNQCAGLLPVRRHGRRAEGPC